MTPPEEEERLMDHAGSLGMISTPLPNTTPLEEEERLVGMEIIILSLPTVLSKGTCLEVPWKALAW